MGGGPPAVVENENFDHLEERLRTIEGRGNYGFADMLELCFVDGLTSAPIHPKV